MQKQDLYTRFGCQVCEREREKLGGSSDDQLAAAAVSPPTQMKPPTPVITISLIFLLDT